MTKKKDRKHDEEQADIPSPPVESADETPAEAQVAEAPDLSAQRDDLLARLQRLSADYLNYQKRAGREIDEARRFANTELVKDFLAVLDDMERALEHAAEDDPLTEGMQLVHDKAMEILGRYGLEPVVAEGKPFDPQRHEAVMAEPSEAHETSTVLRELQRGYEFKGRVLRPAKVVVSSHQPDENAGQNEQTDKGE